MGNKPGFWLAMSIIGTVLLIYLSLVKAPTVRIGPDVENRVMHFLAYTVYTFAVAMWRLTSKPRRFRWAGYLAALFAGMAMGILLELLQIYFPGRDADVADGVSSILGAAAGASLTLLMRGGR
jgi:VanZ family protein